MPDKEITVRGYIYMKLHLMGTRSEEPRYYLQTGIGSQTVEHRIVSRESVSYHKDPYLDKYRDRRYVEVIGIKKGDLIEVSNIKKVEDLILPL